ncbi:hypothetical protein B484DRAFT_409770, partial [Ochromonadaceae sp. CCMP2298]
MINIYRRSQHVVMTTPYIAALGDADGCYDTIERVRDDTAYPENEIRLSISIGSVICNGEPCLAAYDYFGGGVYLEDRSASGRRNVIIYQTTDRGLCNRIFQLLGELAVNKKLYLDFLAGITTAELITGGKSTDVVHAVTLAWIASERTRAAAARYIGCHKTYIKTMVDNDLIYTTKVGVHMPVMPVNARHAGYVSFHLMKTADNVPLELALRLTD